MGPGRPGQGTAIMVCLVTGLASQCSLAAAHAVVGQERSVNAVAAFVSVLGVHALTLAAFNRDDVAFLERVALVLGEAVTRAQRRRVRRLVGAGVCTVEERVMALVS